MGGGRIDMFPDILSWDFVGSIKRQQHQHQGVVESI